MADQLLSIEDSSLTAIANAIRSKGGINSPLEFPDDFVSALQAIETEATITPKITPQQKTLSTSETSFSLQAGFHDGTGTVSIQTQSKSVNPTSSQQTVNPDTGYFLSSVAVGGIGAGTQVVTGSSTLNSATTLTVSGLSFTPVGMVYLIMPDPTAKQYLDQYGSAIQAPNLTLSNHGYGWSSVSGNVSTYYADFSFSSGTATAQYRGNQRFTGTYYYIVWG